MIDFGCIHNGLPRRVHVWFDVDPEESWKAGDRGCLSKSRRDRDPRTGRMGAPRAVKTGLHTADFRADDSPAMFTNYAVSPRRKRAVCMALSRMILAG